jgi:hypothetical protein
MLADAAARGQASLEEGISSIHEAYATTHTGNLGLSLTDVIEHRPGDGRSHGVRPGEGAILRAYADEIDFEESNWPKWLREAP